MYLCESVKSNKIIEINAKNGQKNVKLFDGVYVPEKRNDRNEGAMHVMRQPAFYGC